MNTKSNRLFVSVMVVAFIAIVVGLGVALYELNQFAPAPAAEAASGMHMHPEFTPVVVQPTEMVVRNAVLVAYTGPMAMPEPVAREDACRNFFLFAHENEIQGETDALACAPSVVETVTKKAKDVIVTITATLTSIPSATPTDIVPTTPAPTQPTSTPKPTNTPAPTNTPEQKPTNTPAPKPTNTPAPTATEKENCNNGAGNGSNCTPGHSSGSNQGQGQQTGDQENQGEQGNGNKPAKTPKP